MTDMISDNVQPAENTLETHEETATEDKESAKSSTSETAEPPSSEASFDPQSNQSLSDTEPVPKDQATDDDVGTLEFYIRDGRGDPIPNLELRVLDIGPIRHPALTPAPRKEVFRGKTDSAGRLSQITGLKIGTRFEIQVKKSDGKYKFAAIGSMDAKEVNACLRSPKVRFEFSTFSHQGNPGTAEKAKQEIIKSHNQTPEPTANISRNPDTKPTVKEDRDKQGNPKIIINDGRPNMYGQHTNRIVSSNVGKSDLEKVQNLIEFATEQASWIHPEKMTSLEIINQMKAGRYKKEGTRSFLGYQNAGSKCNKYVKIALWKAGFSHNDSDIAPHISPAKDMGPALLNAGFIDITNVIPDARWAAPGDIIVYELKANPAKAGHIDIRTYDGYLSDFFETYLPVTQFRVTGIYRKFFDPLPELRMRGFLKVIRSREAETVMKKYGDAATYRALPLSAQMGLMFDGFETHPFDEKGGKSTASGAYGTLLSTWKRYTDPKTNPKPWVPLRAGTPKFSPTVQDRIAVAIMELHAGVGYSANKGITALALIRKGEIEKAAEMLATRKPYQWTSLPGGTESKYTVSEMMQDYNKYLSELSGK